MAYITCTYSNESVGNLVKSANWNQNFADIISGTSDGTKDLYIGSLTTNGTNTLSAIMPSVSGVYDIGASGSKFKDLYLSGSKDVGGDVTVTGSLAKDRQVIVLGYLSKGGTIATESGYFNPSAPTALSANESPIVMQRSGRIASITLGAWIETYSGGSPQINAQVYKNGAAFSPILSTLPQTAYVTISGSGGAYSIKKFSGVYNFSFSAGDRLSGWCDTTAAATVSGVRIQTHIEVIFDT